MGQDYRNDQISVARRTNGGATNTGQTYSKPAPRLGSKKPFVARGHDAILKEAQDAGSMLRIITMSDGASHYGKMVARDKFTITIEITTDMGNGPVVTRTFYKHSIESFERV